MSTFDPNPYRKSLDEMVYMFRQGTQFNEISAVSHVPLMAVVLYAQQVLNMPVMDVSTDFIKSFYQYHTVLSFKEALPAHARR